MTTYEIVLSSTLLHPNYLYQIFLKSDLQTIGRFSCANSNFRRLLNENRLFIELIKQKNQERIERKTDVFLTKYGNSSPFIRAGIIGDTEINDELIKRGYNPYDLITDPLSSACVFGNLDKVKQLIQSGKVDPSSPDEMPIYLASLNNHLTIVEYLLRIIKLWNILSPEKRQYYLNQIAQPSYKMFSTKFNPFIEELDNLPPLERKQQGKNLIQSTLNAPLPEPLNLSPPLPLYNGN